MEEAFAQVFEKGILEEGTQSRKKDHTEGKQCIGAGFLCRCRQAVFYNVKI